MGPVRIFFHNPPQYVLKSITWPYKPKKMARNAGKCPTTPLWKSGPSSLFWPKIGHWEKMRYLFKMISTRPFPIDLALIHLRHNPEGPWHPPDTQQTPYRQPKMHVFWLKLGHWRIMWYVVIIISVKLFFNSLGINIPKPNPGGPRHPPDTL